MACPLLRARHVCSSLSWLLAADASAQQPARVPQIGYLGYGAPAEATRRVDELRAGLRDHGYLEGKNTLKAGSPSRPEYRAWELRGDLVVTNALLWVVTVRRAGPLKPEVHLYLYDRYWRLAEYYQRRGKRKKAAQLYEKAEEHYRRSGRTGPPFAAAMAMPRPRSPFFTWVVGKREPRHPNDAA